MSFNATSSVAGENNLSYLNQENEIKPIVIRGQRTPTTTDRRYKIGTIWVDEPNNASYQLTSVSGGVANWLLLGIGAGDLETLQGDAGGVISPNAAGNIVLAGGINITTTGAGNTITFDLDGNITVASMATSDAASGLTISSSDIDADGTDVNIDITVTPKGTGDFIVDSGDIIVVHSDAGANVAVQSTNSDNTDPASNGGFEAAVGGTSAGDPYVNFLISGGQSFTMGIDNSSPNDDFVISDNGALGTNNRISIDGTTGDVSIATGSLSIDTAGKGLEVAEGVNARMGTATLVAGAATVGNTSVTANTRIFLTSQVDGGAPGFLRVSSRNAGTDFTITSSSGTDTSTVAWLLVEPA